MQKTESYLEMEKSLLRMFQAGDIKLGQKIPISEFETSNLNKDEITISLQTELTITQELMDDIRQRQ